MTPEAWIALVALVISAGVALNQWHLQRENNRLQKRLTEIEESRRSEEVAGRSVADVTARIGHRDKHGKKQACLYIINNGPAVARRVRFDERAFPLPVRGADGLPIPSIEPGAEFQFDLMVAWQSPNQVSFDLEWEDDTGARRKTITSRIP